MCGHRQTYVRADECTDKADLRGGLAYTAINLHQHTVNRSTLLKTGLSSEISLLRQKSRHR